MQISVPRGQICPFLNCIILISFVIFCLNGQITSLNLTVEVELMSFFFRVVFNVKKIILILQFYTFYRCLKRTSYQ